MSAGSNVRSMITINASELASVLDRHYYQPRNETMLKVWQRTDQRTFCIANALDHRNKISTLINHYYQTVQTGRTKEALASILVDKWDQDEVGFIQVMKEVFPESDSQGHFRSLRIKILRELKALKLRNCKEEKLLKDSQIQKTELLEEVKKLSENEKRTISESVKEICEKKGIKNEEVIKAVESTLTKDRGTKLESKTVEVFGKEKGVEFAEVDEDLLEIKVMECEGVEWILQGRADALTQDKVIEVKNRKNRFMQPLYDLIQLQAYLYLYDREDGVLLERLSEENQETAVKFEVGFWIDDVIPGMKAFVEELHSIISKNKERFSENCLPSQVEGSTTNKSPSKRSCENDDSPIQDKKPCSGLDEGVAPQKHQENDSLQEKELCSESNDSESKLLVVTGTS